MAARLPGRGRLSGVPASDLHDTDPFAQLDVAAAPSTVLAWGGTLDAATLLSAYRAGVFPWPSGDAADRTLRRLARRMVRAGTAIALPGPDTDVPWCSPDPRAVLLADELVVHRSLRQRLRHTGWTASLDTAFDAVVAACADRGEGTWITERMRHGYAELHRAGAAHSVEVWDGDALVGGLYGVLVGSVFCGESMFARARDASKVALVELCARLLLAGGRLVDVQEPTAHLRSLGMVLVPREQYVARLTVLRDRPLALDLQRHPVARLGG